MLFNEPKLLKFCRGSGVGHWCDTVSVLFNEPKLLKLRCGTGDDLRRGRFSALQRAEIAEIGVFTRARWTIRAVSVLFNEPKLLKFERFIRHSRRLPVVSVLFNEPKLLKSRA